LPDSKSPQELFVRSIAIVTTVGTMVCLLSLPAQASDSTWMLCDNGKLAVNLLEHRNGVQGNISKRTVSIALIFGMNIASGELDNTNGGETSSGRIFLTSTPKNHSKFIGNIAVDYAKAVVSLNGTLTLSGSPYQIRTQLQCKDMHSNL
jgi:hypothetical protein